MDRLKAKMVRGELDKVLADLGQKHGFTFNLGNITFTDTEFRVTLRGIDSNAADTDSVLVHDWNQYKNRYPELARVELGAQFRNDKGVYQIIGLKPQNRKYPVIAKRVTDGKQYKFSAFSISVYMGNRSGL